MIYFKIVVVIIINIGLGNLVNCCNKCLKIKRLYVVKIFLFIFLMLIGLEWLVIIFDMFFFLFNFINCFWLDKCGFFFFKWFNSVVYKMVKKLLIIVVGMSWVISCLLVILVIEL